MDGPLIAAAVDGAVRDVDLLSKTVCSFLPSVVEARRSLHGVFVFTCNFHPLTRIMTSAWRRAKVRIGLEDVRIHDL
jgi:hypothetical protein